MERDPENNPKQEQVKELKELLAVHGVERGTLVALLGATGAIKALNATSSRLAWVNIVLAGVMAIATLLQLLFIFLRK